MTTTLSLRSSPALRLDLQALQPTRLREMTAADIERLPVGLGPARVALAEFFDVSQVKDDAATLILQGDLRRCDRIGWQMEGGLLRAEGSVGDYAGAGMIGGELQVQGHAAQLAACEMSGGRLVVQGDVGDFAASTLPGSMDGMRGGSFIVHGSAGARFADRMRRGSALVFCDVGEFCASRMVAGTIAIGGRCGAHPAYGMRRGSLVFAGLAPAVPTGFVPAGAPAEVFWQLLARDLQKHGGPFTALARRGMARHLGDLAAGGKGECIIAAPLS